MPEDSLTSALAELATDNSEHESVGVKTPNSVTTPDADSGSTVAVRTYLEQRFGSTSSSTHDAAQTAKSELDASSQMPADAIAELAKWRERVPKLASALRQRTEQVTELESQLTNLREDMASASALGNSGGTSTAAGVRARDEHIAELEAKAATLTDRYRNTEGNLRSRELELEDLRGDLDAWKAKWQAVTQSLDEQCELVAKSEQAQAKVKDELTQVQESQRQAQELISSLERELNEAGEQDHRQTQRATALEQELEQTKRSVEDHQGEITELNSELSSLQGRSDNLLETTELANRQLVTLGEDLVDLRQRLQAAEALVVAKSSDLAQLEAQRQSQLQALQQEAVLDMAQVQAEHSQRLRDIHAQTLLVFDAVDSQYQAEQSLQEDDFRQQIDSLNLAATANASVQQVSEQEKARLGSEMINLRDRLYASCAQQQRLRESLTASTAQATQVATQLSEETQQLLDVNAATLLSIDAIEFGLNEQLHTVADRLRSEQTVNSGLQQDLLALQESQRQSTQVLIRREECVVELRTQNQELQANLKQAQASQEAASAQTLLDQTQMAQAVLALEEQQQADRLLMAELYSERAGELTLRLDRLIEQKRQTDSERQVAKAQVETLTEQLAQAKHNQLEQSSSAASQLASSEAASARAMGDLRSEIENLEHRLNEQVTSSTQAQETLITKITVLEAELVTLQTAKEAAATVADQQVQKLQSQLDRELQSMQSQRNEIANLGSQLDGQQANATRDQEQLTAKIAVLEARAAALQAANNTAATSAGDQVQELRSQLDRELESTQSQRNEIAHLGSQLDDQVASATHHEEQLTQQCVALEARVTTLQSANDAVADDTKKQVQDVQARLDKLQQDSERELESQRREHRGQIDELTTERNALAANLLTLEERLQEQLRQQTVAPDVSPTNSSTVADPTADSKSAAPSNADKEVKRLQELVRERTEELNKVLWQQRMQEEQQAASADAPAGRDQKTLLVLNQQLQASRDENELLRDELSALSAAPVSALPDDLTRIKGVGDKLAAQLRELGLTSFVDIASLELDAMESDSHPLYMLRGRIARDGWIDQARAFS